MQEEVDMLIIQIEQLDERILTLNMGRGMVKPEEAQILKYKRCFLFDRLTAVINGEEDDEEWGGL